MATTDPAAVRDALARVLASPGFVNAGRLSRMLRFVVERTLDGGADRLKEYLVGVEVFDRPGDYDPRLDSIVRVEARRLRSKLAEYYAGDGLDDPVRIRLPKGGYTPVFELAPAVPAPFPSSPARADARRPRRFALVAAALGVALLAVVLSARLGPAPARGAAAVEPLATIAVLPFRVFSGSPEDQRVADRLTDGVTTELARDPRLGVTAHTSARQFRQAGRPAREVAEALGARYLMEGTVRVAPGSVLLEGRLVDAAIGRKVWVEDFTGPPDRLDDLERQVAAGLSAALRARRP